MYLRSLILRAVIAASCCYALPLYAASGTSSFRIGFSSSTFIDLNQNDAMAAVRIWAQALAEEKNIPADPQPGIYNNLKEIREALTSKKVDCINLSTVEYYQLRPLLTSDEIVTAVADNSITEEYVVIVSKASKIEEVSQLAGKSVAILDNARTSLSRIWLDTYLARDGHSEAQRFFGKISPFHKVNQAVLPVFFQQVDAAIVTRRSFEIMTELNPQVGEKLKVIAASPPYVPVVFCFRADYDAPLKDRVLKEIANWHLSPSGRQILTIFQTDKLAENPASCLESALSLLAEYQGLKHQRDNAKGA